MHLTHLHRAQARCAPDGTVIIDADDRFTQEEIEIAREIVDLDWPVNVADFLVVIAGHMRPGEPQDLAFAALVYQPQGDEP